MAQGRASRQGISATTGRAAQQTFDAGSPPHVLGGANGSSGCLGLSATTVRFLIGGSMFIASAGSTVVGAFTRIDTVAVGQTGSLGRTFFSTDSLKSTESEGLSGSLGSSETSVSGSDAGAIGLTGSLGSTSATQQTISGTDVAAILNAVIEYDKNGQAITLRGALRLCMAVLLSETDGASSFKSLNGGRTRVSGTSTADGARHGNPTLDISD